ncbi:hypothetical protein [Mycobacterium sp. SMC-4]|uniref:hypothetical protein n=1 Tax=Mycobacterium sp. SMC-4 TaxID=2857059 RepID=UPI0021B306E5|nr:hypothetical protein [Mycobacterium sp. SMC-4]
MTSLVGSGIVTAGLSAAMLAGAGVAGADTDSGGGADSARSSASADAGRERAESRSTDRAVRLESRRERRVGSETRVADEPTEEAVEDKLVADEPVADEPVADEPGDDGLVADVLIGEEPVEHAPTADVPAEHRAMIFEVAESDDATAAPAPTASPASVRRALRNAETPPGASAPVRSTPLGLIGTAVFNMYGLALRVFGGPPILPADSGVTVSSSMLEIDCGDGYRVPADWYVPDGAVPTRLIYSQHGFLAAGPFYSFTAARLAVATNSIVVTTSLTSNFLACDGCWLGGSPMHQAVANLFAVDSTALADSAQAAGYGAVLAGVHDVVLVGHSLGGGLAAGAAGAMTGNGALGRLAGVVMLDGVGFGPVVPTALATLPVDMPVFNLSGKSYFWNQNGAANLALAQARPDAFTGVRLIGGLHSDPMTGGNPLIQFALNLVTGFSRAENVTAAEILSAAWINDMFSRTGPDLQSPFYGAPGETLQIQTARGLAQAYVSPGPPERLTLIDIVFTAFTQWIFTLNFAACVPAGDAMSHASVDRPAKMSTPNTLLSLDDGAKPRQSNAQHVCTG